MKLDVGSQFVNNIYTLLPCKSSEKKRMLADFKTDVSQYVEENHIQQMEELYEHFGTPECIASAYSGTLAAPAGARKLKIFTASLLAVIFAALALIAVLTTVNFVKTAEYQNGYYVDVIRVEKKDDHDIKSNALAYYAETKGLKGMVK